MNLDLTFRTGEATVFAAPGQVTDAMPEILIGRVDGPAGHAFANMMAQSKGHTAMFAIRACNQLVRPATIVVPKVTLKDMGNIDLFGGVVQGATADAVVDCLIEHIRPALEEAGDLEQVRELAERAVASGGAAERQRVVLRRRGDVRDVVDALIAETVTETESA